MKVDEGPDYFYTKKRDHVFYWAAQAKDGSVVAGFPDGMQETSLPVIHSLGNPHLPHCTRLGLCNQEQKGR